MHREAPTSAADLRQSSRGAVSGVCRLHLFERVGDADPRGFASVIFGEWYGGAVAGETRGVVGDPGPFVGKSPQGQPCAAWLVQTYLSHHVVDQALAVEVGDSSDAVKHWDAYIELWSGGVLLGSHAQWSRGG